MISNLYKYRQLLKSNIKKEIRGKYKGSFLGVLWSFVNPLLSVLVYAIVFPLILKNTQEHYVTYLIIGIIPWNFFVYSISQGTTTIMVNGGIIKKVYFPREILPISVVSSALVNFLISCLIILLFLLFSGIGISKYIVFMPIVIIIQYIMTLGIVFITSAINVYIRDAEYIINFFINMLFYATPILYSQEIIPARWRNILSLNPMAIIINGYRDILYYQRIPDFTYVLLLFLFSILLLLFGIFVFKKLERGFAEEV